MEKKSHFMRIKRQAARQPLLASAALAAIGSIIWKTIMARKR